MSEGIACLPGRWFRRASRLSSWSGLVCLLSRDARTGPSLSRPHANGTTPADSIGLHGATRPECPARIPGLLDPGDPGRRDRTGRRHVQLRQDLEVSTNNITIRGKGIDKTILSFKNQHMGSKGIEATGDNFVIEDLAVEDTRGNAIKVVGAKNVTFRHVRTSWTGEPKTSNGAYGVYPVSCENVLIDGCIVRGAADAGVYVGQSRTNRRQELPSVTRTWPASRSRTRSTPTCSTIIATNNSGGILVFDLPGLDLHNGGRVRVFHNKVPKNNHAEFRRPGFERLERRARHGHAAVGDGQRRNLRERNHRQQHGRPAGDQLHPHRQPDQRPESTIRIPSTPTSTTTTFPAAASIRAAATARCSRKSSGHARFPKSSTTACSIPRHVKDGKRQPDYGIRFERNGNVGFANIHFDELTPEKIAAGKDRHRSQHRRLHRQLSAAPRHPAPAARPRRPSSDTVGRRSIARPRKSSPNTGSSRGTA